QEDCPRPPPRRAGSTTATTSCASAFGQLALQVAHVLLELLQFGARARQHLLLDIKLLAADQVEPGDGLTQHRACIVFHFPAQLAEAAGQTLAQLGHDAIDKRLVVHWVLSFALWRAV